MSEPPELPPFPVDPETLRLLDAAIRPGVESDRTSLGEFLELMTRLGGGDPDEVGYHHNDVIAALLDEVCWLREGRPMRTWYRSVRPDGRVWAESSNPADFAPGGPAAESWPASAGERLTFWRCRSWIATERWQPWDPSGGG